MGRLGHLCAGALIGMAVLGGTPRAETMKIDLTLCAKKAQIDNHTVQRLREYADFLRGAGRSTDATRVDGYAQALAAPASQASQYMGFDPQKVLNEYAAALQASGRAAQARAIRADGQRFYDSNVACFVLQQRQMAPRR